MKKIALFLLAIVMVSGCITREKCLSKFPPQIIKSDSFITQTITHDSVILKEVKIQLPADSTGWKMFFKCRDGSTPTETGTQDRTSKLIKMQESYINGTLNIKCKFDTLTIVKNYLEHNKLTTTNNKETKTITKEVQVNVVTSFQWFEIWGFKILILLLVVAVIIMYLAHIKF